MTAERYNEIVDLIMEYGVLSLRQGRKPYPDNEEEQDLAAKAFAKIAQELSKEITFDE